ncbi:hypothetical protein C7S13_3310 [Burkholderia cepacia]|nr:hypothetical protein [Burkholderia cepacia]
MVFHPLYSLSLSCRVGNRRIRAPPVREVTVACPAARILGVRFDRRV